VVLQDINAVDEEEEKKTTGQRETEILYGAGGEFPGACGDKEHVMQLHSTTATAVQRDTSSATSPANQQFDMGKESLTR